MTDIIPSKLKVVELREELAKRDLPTTGLKAVLVARLEEALENEKQESKSEDEEQKEDEPMEEEKIVEDEKESTDDKKTEQEQPKSPRQRSPSPAKQSIVETDITEPEPVNRKRKSPERSPPRALTPDPSSPTKQTIVDEPAEEKKDDLTINTAKRAKIEDASTKQQSPLSARSQDGKSKPEPKLNVIVDTLRKAALETMKTRKNSTNSPTTTTTITPTSSLPPRSASLPKASAHVNGSNEPSNTLLIKGFTRPLTLPAVKSLLAEYGEVKKFWMDSIKTHCFVTYETTEIAESAKTGIDGIQFPPTTGKNLSVTFGTEAQIDERLDSSGPVSAREQRRSLANKLMDRDRVAGVEKPVANDDKKLDTNESGESVSAGGAGLTIRGRGSRRYLGSNEIEEMNHVPARLEVQPEPEPMIEQQPRISGWEMYSRVSKPLDQLFRKTTTNPPIYWLPLTDEQVKEKKERQQRNERSQRNDRSERSEGGRGRGGRGMDSYRPGGNTRGWRR